MRCARLVGPVVLLGLAGVTEAGAVDPAAVGGADQEQPVAYRVPERPRLQIGSVDGDGSGLYGVTDAFRLRDGRILVVNAGSRELKLFDSQGAFLGSLGREGVGPGEFRSVSHAAELEDGRIAALDPLLRRVTLFSSAGRLEDTYRVSPGSDGTGPRVKLYGFLANGLLIGLEEVEGEGVETHYGDYPSSMLIYRAPVVQPVLIDTAGRSVPFARPMRGDETVSQTAVSVTSERINVGGMLVPVPFLRTMAVDARGSRIALGPLAGTHLIAAFDADGDLLGGFGGPPPKEAPERIREAWLDDWLSRFGSRSEREQWRDRYEEFLSATAPATFPPFKSVVVQEGGAVWREVYDPALEEDHPSRWSVKDPTVLDFGGAATLPPGFHPYDIGTDYVLGEWSDELGIEYVRVYDLIKVPRDP